MVAVSEEVDCLDVMGCRYFARGSVGLGRQDTEHMGTLFFWKVGEGCKVAYLETYTMDELDGRRSVL